MLIEAPCVPTVACHVSPPLGCITVTLEEIVNVLSLLSQRHPGSTNSEILILARFVGLLGIVQAYDPVAGVEETIVLHVEPLLTEYSILTFDTDEGLNEYVIFCEVPVIQFCPPLGVNTINDPFIVKVELLTSTMVGVKASSTFIKQFEEFRFGSAGHAYDPVRVL